MVHRWQCQCQSTSCLQSKLLKVVVCCLDFTAALLMLSGDPPLVHCWKFHRRTPRRPLPHCSVLALRSTEQSRQEEESLTEVWCLACSLPRSVVPTEDKSYSTDYTAVCKLNWYFGKRSLYILNRNGATINVSVARTVC